MNLFLMQIALNLMDLALDMFEMAEIDGIYVCYYTKLLKNAVGSRYTKEF